MDFSEINLTLFIIAALIGVAALALHILSAFLGGPRAELVSYINVGLHVPFIVLIALSGAPIIVGVMLVLTSLCVYIAAEYFAYHRQMKNVSDSESGEDKR